MNSMSKLIKGHNKKVTSKPPDQRLKWNCRKKTECPMEGNCQVNNIVYKCDVIKPFSKNVYLGLAERELKSRFYDYKLSYKHKRYSNKTTLSSYLGHLKSVSSETCNLKWSVLRCVPLYSYFKEMPLVLIWKAGNSYQNLKEQLNKRSELICKCRHANRFLSKNYIGNDLYN